MTKRVAMYARVSTTRQAEHDISIPDQIARAERYCHAHKWDVVARFIDPGASARDDKRPQFQAMMESACVDPSPFDVILVHSQSRFFREVGGYVWSKRRLQKHGVSLVSLTQDFGEGASADFAETIIAAADAFNSAETAKHVSRSMLENARQGFWNGAKPPFGYRTKAAEQRGQRTKKKLEIETKDAETVRLIFKLFLQGDGRSGPKGVKDIASWLNAHGHTFGKGLFYTSAVHAILTRDTYSGTHYFNRHDSRTKRERPREEWIAQVVPEIIPPKTFQRVQELLQARRPSMTPPRVSNSDVLLTGLARCECCGAPLMVRTGKGGRYRYYACSANRLKGNAACSKPVAIRESQLDDMVLTALSGSLLTPERLPVLLQEARKHQHAKASSNLQRRSGLRKRVKELEAEANRMYAALRQGMVPNSDLFQAQLSAIERDREECIRHLSRIDAEAPQLRQTLSKQQATALAQTLQRRLLDAPKAALRRRYVQGLISEILVDRERAIVTGPRSAIAAAATSGEFDGGVRSFVREWRTGEDSNFWRLSSTRA